MEVLESPLISSQLLVKRYILDQLLNLVRIAFPAQTRLNLALTIIRYPNNSTRAYGHKWEAMSVP
jgi:hypothetical protein